MRTPSARAASATACVAPCGSRWPSPARWTAPYSESGEMAGIRRPGLLRPDHLGVEADAARPAGGPLELAQLRRRDASRRLPTVSNAPSRRYSSML